MINKEPDQISQRDLQSLIDNSVTERKTIEYKKVLPGNTDSDKKEFLADVSSFANASGGDLIYGISEEKGIPTSLTGLDVENTDREISRLESMVRDGIEPRIPSITLKDIPLNELRKALLIRIPKSWVSPHRVSFKGHDKFYSRSSNGKYPMDVTELRIAFNLSEAITEKIRRFMLERISRIHANETPVPMPDSSKIILHLIPIISFNPARAYNIQEIASQSAKMPPIACPGGNDRYNLEGIVTYSGTATGESSSYAQLYRNGIIEAVEGSLLISRNRELSIPSIKYERELIKAVTSYLRLMQNMSIEPPVILFLTITKVKGYHMATRQVPWPDMIHPIDRDLVFLPEVLIQSYESNAQSILRPCFDALWNACGFARSLNYNEKGEWIEEK